MNQQTYYNVSVPAFATRTGHKAHFPHWTSSQASVSFRLKVHNGRVVSSKDLKFWRQKLMNNGAAVGGWCHPHFSANELQLMRNIARQRLLVRLQQPNAPRQGNQQNRAPPHPAAGCERCQHLGHRCC